MEILTEEEPNMLELNFLVLKYVFYGVADPGEGREVSCNGLSVGSSIDLSTYRSYEVSYHSGGRICGL